MAYTSTDLDNVRAARLALAQGTRKVRVTIADKTVEYAFSDDDKLARLEAKIEAELAAAERAAGTTRRRYFMLSSEKGL
jgi:hypothetical protein